MADGQITLAGFPLVYDDGTVTRTVEDIVGWYDSPPLRVSYTARPYAAGSYYSPAYMDVRKVTITGRIIGADTVSYIKAKRQLGALAVDPLQLSTLQVTDDAGSRMSWVQRSADVLFKPQGAYAADYSLTVTSPDPRLLATEPSTSTTQMAQSTGLGIQWRGSDGLGGIQWRGSDGLGGIQWRGTDGGSAASGSVLLDNTAGTAPADILLTFRGPALNPAATTGTDKIRYNGSLGASDVLTVNTGSGAVLLNGINRRPYLSSAQFFLVPAESSLDVQFSAEVQNTTATMTASFQVSDYS